jgi:hypothetical protein
MKLRLAVRKNCKQEREDYRKGRDERLALSMKVKLLPEQAE